LDGDGHAEVATAWPISGGVQVRISPSHSKLRMSDNLRFPNIPHAGYFNISLQQLPGFRRGLQLVTIPRKRATPVRVFETTSTELQAAEFLGILEISEAFQSKGPFTFGPPVPEPGRAARRDRSCAV
jgi:hypothetical protein